MVPTAPIPIPIIPERLGYSIPEAAILLGVSPRTIYNLLASGDLASFTINSSRRIPHAALQTLIDRRMEPNALESCEG